MEPVSSAMTIYLSALRKKAQAHRNLAAQRQGIKAAEQALLDAEDEATDAHQVLLASVAYEEGGNV